MWCALARFFCRAHVGIGSEAIVEQESQQVRASGIDSHKFCVDHYAEQIHHTILQFAKECVKFLAELQSTWTVWTTSSLQTSYHVQSEKNAGLHWLAQ